MGPYVLPLVVVAAHFGAFTAARLILLLTYPSDFAALSAGEVAAAFLRGLRFDSSVFFTWIGVPVFLSMLPFRWARTQLWQKLCGWTCFAMFVAFSFVLAVDVAYFGYVHRHLGPELTMLSAALDEVAWKAFTDYLPGILLFAAAAAGLGWLWGRLLRRAPPAPARGLVWHAAACLAAFGLMYVGHRGTLEGKRTKIVHAFSGVTPASAYLSLNGPFTATHSVYGRQGFRADFLPWDEAVAATRELLFSPGETAVDERYPLLRSRPPRDGERPNVVVVMLESWDAVYVDVIRRDMGLEPLGLSPCFDAISRESALFTRFYAAGQKSMDGLSSLLCGFPTLPHTPYIGLGMEQSRLSFLGELGRQEGYQTIFMQSSLRDSFRCDQIAPRAGFDHYLGGEDVLKNQKDSIRSDRGMAWDHQLFREASRQFSARKEPFLGFLFTSSTHFPFAWPETWKPKYSGDSRQERYLNSLQYSDWALGQFFEEARKTSWFDRTVFVICADHTMFAENATADDPATLHHIPGLVLAPGLKPAVDRSIVSQLDVVPTVVDLAGWSVPYACLGRSLLDASAGPTRGAMVIEGDVVARLEPGGWVTHNLKSRVIASRNGAAADLDAIERRLLGFVQCAAVLLRENRLAGPPK